MGEVADQIRDDIEQEQFDLSLAVERMRQGCENPGQCSFGGNDDPYSIAVYKCFTCNKTFDI